MTDDIPRPFCVRFASLRDTRDDSIKIVWFRPITPELMRLDEPSIDQLRELHAAGLLHGPFATKDEAKRDMMETLLGPDCEVFDGGTTALGPPQH
jgi:hypothetical protein